LSVRDVGLESIGGGTCREIYGFLRMWGQGFALKEVKPNDMPPMNWG